MLRLTSSILFAGLVVVGAAACSDNKKTVDAAGGCGHTGCLEAGVPMLSDPEGGQIIFEYIYFDTELQAALGVPPTAQRVIAFFMNAQTPQDNPLPMAGQCNNLVSTKGWPEYVGTPHTDLDVGALTITGMNTAGTSTPVTIPKGSPLPGTDAIGRMHDIYYQVVNPTAANYQKPDSKYTVTFGGAGVVPADTFDGRDADHPQILLANTFQVNNPTLEGNGPLVAGTDFTVNWTPATTTSLGPNDTVLGVTWLVDLTGAPTHMCPTLHSAGTMTIPGASIAEYKAIAQSRGLPTNKVIMLRNAIVHHIARLPNGNSTSGDPANQRRVDFLSVLCWAQMMDLQ